jgi:hypothetical protein
MKKNTMTTHLSKKREDWEKEFDEKFTQWSVQEGLQWRAASPSIDGMPNYDWCTPKEVKVFIHSLLTKQREEIITKIKKLQVTRRKYERKRQ